MKKIGRRRQIDEIIDSDDDVDDPVIKTGKPSLKGKPKQSVAPPSRVAAGGISQFLFSGRTTDSFLSSIPAKQANDVCPLCTGHQAGPCISDFFCLVLTFSQDDLCIQHKS